MYSLSQTAKDLAVPLGGVAGSRCTNHIGNWLIQYEGEKLETISNGPLWEYEPIGPY